MEIKSPSRELIGQALRAQSAELLRTGQVAEATRVQQDLTVLSGAPGDSLYDKHFEASERARATWPKHESVAASWKASPAFFGAELVGAAGLAAAWLFRHEPIVAGAGLAVTAGVAALHVVYQVKARRRSQAQAVLQAIARRQDAICNFVPSNAPTPLNIERNAFMATLKGQEARLVENRDYAGAGNLRRLREGLEPVPGQTVDELFENLLQDGSRKETLQLLQGDCSQQVFEGLRALAEVVKLTSPGQGGLQDGADSVVVGGVVIRKRAA